MAIPDFQELMLPLLKLLVDGEVHHISELRERLAQQFDLSELERAQLMPSGRARLFDLRPLGSTHRA